MGCRESKVDPPESMERRKSNVSAFSRLPGETDAPPSEIDPRSPLNFREIYRLKASWRGIKRNMEQTGVEMFINLFRSDEEILHLFQGFTHIQGDSLRENEALEAHAMLVMNTLDKAITNFEKYDFVINHLLNVGATHTRFTGFKVKYFRYMETPFLNSIKLTLGDRYTDGIAKLYTVAIDLILGTLQRGMRTAMGEQNQMSSDEKPESNGGQRQQQETTTNEEGNHNQQETKTKDEQQQQQQQMQETTTKDEPIIEDKKINENSNHITTPSCDGTPTAIVVST